MAGDDANRSYELSVHLLRKRDAVHKQSYKSYKAFVHENNHAPLSPVPILTQEELFDGLAAENRVFETTYQRYRGEKRDLLYTG